MHNRTLSASIFPTICRLLCLLTLFTLVGKSALGASGSMMVTGTASVSSPQAVNTAISLTATVTGGTNVQYQFWIYNVTASPAWQQLQAYSTSATCLWTPMTAGDYLLSISARDGGTGTEAYSTFWYTITATAPLSAVMLSPSLPAPQSVNTSITLTATATGGTDVQYQFWVYNPSASPGWSQLQAYSSSPICNWMPTTVGNYLLSVTARDGGTGIVVNNTLWYTISGPALTAVSVTAAPAAPQPINTAITLTAAATGGTNLQYQFWLYNQNAIPAWSQLQAYSTSATCTWIPTSPGDYMIAGTALDGVTGTTMSNTFRYGISGPVLTAVSLTASPTSPQSVTTPITLTAAATGGTSMRYQFWMYNPSMSPAWSQLQAYSASATCVWTPTVPGSCLFSITALDSVTGTTVNNTLWFTANPPPLTAISLTTSHPSPQYAGISLTLTAVATGGANVRYQFWVYNASATPAWSQLQAYSSSATCTWTPATAGNYQLSATARDSSTGAEVNQTLWYIIFSGQANYANYYPMAVGDRWYFTDGTMQYSNGAVAQVTLGNQSAIKVRVRTKNSMGTTAKYKFYANDGANFSIFGSDDNTDTTTYRYSPPVVISKLTPGQPVTFTGNWLVDGVSTGNYTFKVKMLGLDTVTVPAGTFNNCLVVQLNYSMPGQDATNERVWLAPGVGHVQEVDLTTGDIRMLTGAVVGNQNYGTVPQLTSVSLSATPPSQQEVNMPVTLTAQQTDWTFTHFQFWLYNPSATPAWSELQAYSSSATCIWTPTATGSYMISATAQDIFTNATANQTLWYTVNAPTADQDAIQALFATLQTVVENHSVSDMMALFSPDYLQEGEDYTLLQEKMSDPTHGIATVQSVAYTITDIAVTGNTAQVFGTVTVTFIDQSSQSWTEPSTKQDVCFGWLIKTNGQWLFYGDQQLPVTARVTVGNYVNPSTGNRYFLGMSVNGATMKSVIVSGPNIPTTSIPVQADMGNYWANITPSQLPQIGDQYTFVVTFTDDTQRTLTDTVKSLVSVAPTLAITQPSAGALSFTWNDVASQIPNAASYYLYVMTQNNNRSTIWSENLPINTLSGTFNSDGSATMQLISGQTYNCGLQINDQYGDCAYTIVPVTITGQQIIMY